MIFDNTKILITGTDSGLGKFILDKIPSASFLNRSNRVDIVNGDTKYDIIIHSAYNPSRVNFTDLDLKYVDDNLILTSELINLSGGCFIYVSSIDTVNKIESPYALFKKLSGDLIKSKIENHFIIKLTHLIQCGESDKIPGSLKKIINNEPITLTENSKFNLVCYEDVYEYIKMKIENKILDKEINLVNSTSIQVSDVVKILNKNDGTFNYGKFEYSPYIPKKSYIIKKSSIEILMEYLKEIKYEKN